MAQNFEAAVVTQGFTDMNPSQTNTGKARISDSVMASVNYRRLRSEESVNEKFIDYRISELLPNFALIKSVA